MSSLLLIKAEALIMQGKNGEEPLNRVRERAGLDPKTRNRWACDNLGLTRFFDSDELTDFVRRGGSSRKRI